MLFCTNDNPQQLLAFTMNAHNVVARPSGAGARPQVARSPVPAQLTSRPSARPARRYQQPSLVTRVAEAEAPAAAAPEARCSNICLPCVYLSPCLPMSISACCHAVGGALSAPVLIALSRGKGHKGHSQSGYEETRVSIARARCYPVFESDAMALWTWTKLCTTRCTPQLRQTKCSVIIIMLAIRVLHLPSWAKLCTMPFALLSNQDLLNAVTAHRHLLESMSPRPASPGSWSWALAGVPCPS